MKPNGHNTRTAIGPDISKPRGNLRTKQFLRRWMLQKTDIALLNRLHKLSLMAADSSGSQAGNVLRKIVLPICFVQDSRKSAIPEERNNVGRVTIVLRSGMIQGRSPCQVTIAC